jgi:hypothetical protein
MKYVKLYLSTILTFISLKESYANTVTVDVYIEGPGLNARTQKYPNPDLGLSIGRGIGTIMFEVEGDQLDSTGKRLLQAGVKLNVIHPKGRQRPIVPPFRYSIADTIEHTIGWNLCGSAADHIKAYNGADKPLKSVTFMTKMELSKRHEGYSGRCELKTEYEQ